MICGGALLISRLRAAICVGMLARHVDQARRLNSASPDEQTRDMAGGYSGVTSGVSSRDGERLDVAVFRLSRGQAGLWRASRTHNALE